MNPKLKQLIEMLDIPDEEKQKKLDLLAEDLKIPVKIIGIGQTGVGKTELLKSIFKISDSDIVEHQHFHGNDADYSRLETGAVRSVTKSFFSFMIENEEGFRVQFTDGPGLGESTEKEEEYLEEWVKEIPNHDLLYWVLDGSSRDVAHIQKNMAKILDRTGYRKKLVVVLNKVDQILLSQEMEIKGVVGWDLDFNGPSKALRKLIEERTSDIIEKLEEYVEISRDQIVVCSARKRWNHDQVFDKFMEYLPEEKKIKVSRHREIKDHTELMSDLGKKAVAADIVGE